MRREEKSRIKGKKRRMDGTREEERGGVFETQRGTLSTLKWEVNLCPYHPSYLRCWGDLIHLIDWVVVEFLNYCFEWLGGAALPLVVVVV